MAAEPTNPDPHPHAAFVATAPALAALAQLELALGARAPFVLVTGNAGMGKRTLVHESLRRMAARVTAAQLDEPAPEAAALAGRLLVLFGGREQPGKSAAGVLERLLESLANATAGGRVAVLIVPAAHALPAAQLIELERITTAAARRQCPLEVWLVGLPALESQLGETPLAGVLERVSVNCRCAPLSPADVRHHLHMRAADAGGTQPAQFSRKACRDIHAATHGVPGEIEALAGESARRAARANASIISPEHVRAAAATLHSRRAANSEVASEAQQRPAAKPAAGRSQAPARPAARSATSSTAIATPKPVPAPSPVIAGDIEFPTSSDPRVQDWVSRFGGGGSVCVGANYTRPLTAAELMDDATNNTSAGDDSEAFLRPNSAAPPPPRPRGRPLGRSAPRVPRAAFGGVIAAALLALLLAQRGGLTPGRVQTGMAAATPADGITGEGSAEVVPEHETPTVTVRQRRAARRAASEAGTRERFSVAVGTFLSRDMALAEEHHLARLSPYKVWITSSSVGGVRMYRLMLGSFRSLETAEAAAQSLMRRGLLRDANVVELPAGARRR